MWDRFRERFTLITGESTANAFGQNVWVENDLAVASIGLAIQGHILPRLEQATWDLVIFDEARKLSAYRYGSSGQIDETKRYKLAERRTQIRHQEMLLPGTGGKVTPKKANCATHLEELERKRHISWGQKRLGNSYASNLSRRGWGQGKVFNKEQRGSRPHARDATGSSCAGRARRPGLSGAGDLLRARQKDKPLYSDAMLRISPGSRDTPAAVGWEPYSGWWEVLAGTAAA